MAEGEILQPPLLPPPPPLPPPSSTQISKVTLGRKKQHMSLHKMKASKSSPSSASSSQNTIMETNHTHSPSPKLLPAPNVASYNSTDYPSTSSFYPRFYPSQYSNASGQYYSSSQQATFYPSDTAANESITFNNHSYASSHLPSSHYNHHMRSNLVDTSSVAYYHSSAHHHHNHQANMTNYGMNSGGESSSSSSSSASSSSASSVSSSSSISPNQYPVNDWYLQYQQPLPPQHIPATSQPSQAPGVQHLHQHQHDPAFSNFYAAAAVVASSNSRTPIMNYS